MKCFNYEKGRALATQPLLTPDQEGPFSIFTDAAGNYITKWRKVNKKMQKKVAPSFGLTEKGRVDVVTRPRCWSLA